MKVWWRIAKKWNIWNKIRFLRWSQKRLPKYVLQGPSSQLIFLEGGYSIIVITKQNSSSLRNSFKELWNLNADSKSCKLKRPRDLKALNKLGRRRNKKYWKKRVLLEIMNTMRNYFKGSFRIILKKSIT